MSSLTDICENSILAYLSTSEEVCIEDTYPWSLSIELDPLVVIGAVNSLLTEGYVATQDLSTTFYTLTAEGESILANGSQEMIVYNTIKELSNHTDGQPVTMEEIETKINQPELCKIGFGNCLKNKWITKNGNEYTIAAGVEVTDTTQQALQSLSDGNFAKDAIDDKVRTTQFKCTKYTIPYIMYNQIAYLSICWFYLFILRLVRF
jgi:phenylalanyl-tRNA synthetase alpha chain